MIKKKHIYFIIIANILTHLGFKLNLTDINFKNFNFCHSFGKLNLQVREK